MFTMFTRTMPYDKCANYANVSKQLNKRTSDLYLNTIYKRIAERYTTQHKIEDLMKVKNTIYDAWLINNLVIKNQK